MSLVSITLGQNIKNDSLIEAGKTYFSSRDFKKAYFEFEKVLTDAVAENSDLYYYGIVSAVQCHKIDQGFIWLDDYINASQAPQVSFYRLQYDLDQMYKDSRWPAALTKMQRKLQVYDKGKGYDLDLKEKLDDLFYMDQKDRIRIAPYEKIYGDTSRQMVQLWDTMGHQDSLNLATLTGLWDKHGWISKKQVGSSSVAQWAVIQHADLATQEKYLPILKKAAEAGDIRKGSLALTIDRIRLGEGKKQLYGSQIKRIKWGGHYINIIQPLEDPSNVDKRRKEMGMEPMVEYAKRFDIDWSIQNYKAGIEKSELSKSH